MTAMAWPHLGKVEMSVRSPRNEERTLQRRNKEQQRGRIKKRKYREEGVTT
jgi:hypothetical protein